MHTVRDHKKQHVQYLRIASHISRLDMYFRRIFQPRLFVYLFVCWVLHQLTNQWV